jgi:hypothetical protein
MLTKVISGGQTGADLAAWKAARRFGIKTGGFMPGGYLTEDGPRPEFAALYGAREHESPEYPPRTRANVLEADGTLVFALKPPSPGTALTLRIAQDAVRRHGKTCCAIAVGHKAHESRAWRSWYPLNDAYDPAWVALWIERTGIGTLNVAGPRESRAPGIGAWVEAYLCEVFRLLGHEETK